MKIKKSNKHALPHKNTTAKKSYGKPKAHTVHAIKHAKAAAKAHATRNANRNKKIASTKAAFSIARLAAINEAISDSKFSDYIAKNVGKKGEDIIKLLADYQTDESIAAKTNIKINEVRRMLNSLNTIGVARYESDKANNGWLTFRWYIDPEKLRGFVYKVNEENNDYSLPENCNDFFVCEKCFEENKTIFPFWTAEEMNFKCECGRMMKRIDKEEAERLILGEKESL
ncbi:MAG: hypothetical protein ACP5K9_00230 [Candidatus Micrarchaeia archaeon]